MKRREFLEQTAAFGLLAAIPGTLRGTAPKHSRAAGPPAAPSRLPRREASPSPSSFPTVPW